MCVFIIRENYSDKSSINNTDFEIMNTRMYSPDKVTGIAKYTDIVIRDSKKIFF